MDATFPLTCPWGSSLALRSGLSVTQAFWCNRSLQYGLHAAFVKSWVPAEASFVVGVKAELVQWVHGECHSVLSSFLLSLCLVPVTLGSRCYCPTRAI